MLCGGTVAGTRTELDRARPTTGAHHRARFSLKVENESKPYAHTNEWVVFPFFFGQLNHVSARWLDVGLEKTGGDSKNSDTFYVADAALSEFNLRDNINNAARTMLLGVYRMLRLTDSRFFELAPFRSIGFPPPTESTSLCCRRSISVCVYCVLPNTTSSIKSGKRAKKKHISHNWS